MTLGATSTFAFIPAIGIVILIALSLYTVSSKNGNMFGGYGVVCVKVFGESLVHFGSVESQPPQYVNPYELLGYPYTDQ